jgi:hypothetical protein
LLLAAELRTSRFLLIAPAAPQRSLRALVLHRSIKHTGRAFQASSPKTSKAGPCGRLFLSPPGTHLVDRFHDVGSRQQKEADIGMKEALSTNVLQVIERTPQWVRHDLDSKDAAVRSRAEETLAAMIAAALDEVSASPVS